MCSSFVNGLLACYKPPGMSSNMLLQILRRTIAQSERPGVPAHVRSVKIGHGGTLDPGSSGVLVVGVGSGTKRLEPFIRCNKGYAVTCQLGITTNTYEVFGERTVVLQRQSWGHVTPALVHAALPVFCGLLHQRPPPFSAIHTSGTRAYKLALGHPDPDSLRAQLSPRPVHVHDIKLVDFDAGTGVLRLHLVCSSGFYVRSLVHDLGQHLGTGAAVHHLERTAQGAITLSHCLGYGGPQPDPRGWCVEDMRAATDTFPSRNDSRT